MLSGLVKYNDGKTEPSVIKTEHGGTEKFNNICDSGAEWNHVPLFAIVCQLSGLLPRTEPWW